MQKILSKHKLKEFLLNLSKSYEVIIPIKDKNTKFEVLTNKNIDLLYLDTITEVPVKEFFLPEKEVLLEFNNGKIIEPKPDKKKRIIFGLRKCDLNALLVLDVVMKDPNYITKRQNTLLIGLFCENPDEYCFCNSMSLVDYYDLFLYPNLENYQISIGSQSGLKLVNELKETKNTIVKEPINKKALKNKDIGFSLSSFSAKIKVDR